MKNHNFIIAFILFLIFFYSASGQDNNKWKDLSNVNTNNSCLFRVDSLRPPAIECNTNARWDYFVIYTDGTFSTTRFFDGDNNHHFYKINSSCNNVNTSQHYSNFSDPIHQNNYAFPSGKTPAFMYIGNIYDSDEPPSIADVITDTNISSALQLKVNNISEVTKPGSKYIFAHQDIVAGDDIVLVIVGSQSTQNPITLSFPNYLDIAPVTNNSFQIYKGQWAAGEFNQVDNNNNIRQINFKPHENSPHTYIRLKANDSIPVPSITFNIQGYHPYTENVLSAHDPNYLCVAKCQEIKENCHVRNLKINFFNDGDNATRTVKVNLKFSVPVNIDQAQFSGCDISGDQRYAEVDHQVSDNIYSFKKALICKSCPGKPNNPESNGQLWLKVNFGQDLSERVDYVDLISSAEVCFDENNCKELTLSSECAISQNAGISDSEYQICECSSEEPGDTMLIFLVVSSLFIVLIIYFLLKRKSH